MQANATMLSLLTGAIALASFIVGLFFFRFWHTTRDRFFLYFALSFWIESVNRIYLSLAGEMREDFPIYYFIRLISYGLILFAIWGKNRKSAGSGSKRDKS